MALCRPKDAHSLAHRSDRFPRTRETVRVARFNLGESAGLSVAPLSTANSSAYRVSTRVIRSPVGRVSNRATAGRKGVETVIGPRNASELALVSGSGILAGRYVLSIRAVDAERRPGRLATRAPFKRPVGTSRWRRYLHSCIPRGRCTCVSRTLG
jgi:hypothetical protein